LDSAPDYGSGGSRFTRLAETALQLLGWSFFGFFTAIDG